MNSNEYRELTDRLIRQLAGDSCKLSLVHELEKVLRHEIEHSIPYHERLTSRLTARPSSRRTALISDIHGHQAGLATVLADIEQQRCDRIVCLGDLVEGGTDDEAVITTLQRLNVPCVRGNHDEINDVSLNHSLRQFLQQLPEHIVERDVHYTHISPRPRKRKINHAVEAWNVFDECGFRLLFIGHVHVPMIFGMKSNTFGEAAVHQVEYNKSYRLSSDDRYIISIGAVAYGRDYVGKVRYAIYDSQENSIEFRAIDGPLLPMDYTLRTPNTLG